MRVWELEKDETAQNSLLKPKKKPLRRRGCMMLMETSYEQAAKKYGEWNTRRLKSTASGIQRDISRNLYEALC